MRYKIFTSLFFFTAITLISSFSQNALIGDTAQPAHPSALLELRSNTKGFLLPRLTTTQRNAIVSPANALQIYNTTTNCIQIYMPLSGWRSIVCDCQNPPSAAFTSSPNTPGINSPVTFTPGSPGLTYSWTFQNGNPATSTAQNPSVTWANPGTYTVTLTVTSQGCSSTQTASVTVTNCLPGSQTFNYTGGSQTFTVPNCVTLIHIQAWGAQGGTSGGLGGMAMGDMTVTPGQTLNVYVGGAGSSSGPGGYNGGGNSSGSTYGGSGGGASDVRTAGNTLNDRVIVAGGGGGGTNGSTPTPGGGGGGLTGVAGPSGGGFTGGGGGTPSAGGAAGCCYGGTDPGVFGIGGGNGSYHNAGGGGGWYGGGSGAGHAGAGGGSSYLGSLTSTTTTPAVRNGNGQVVISW